MRVMLEFAGGPMDGTVELEGMPKQGEEFASWEQAVVATAYFQTKGEVGKRFSVLSLGRLTSTVVRNGSDRVFPSFTYEVTNHLTGEDEILIQARFVQQNG